jgi:hypothetical protein
LIQHDPLRSLDTDGCRSGESGLGSRVARPTVEVPLADGGSILVEVDEPVDVPAIRGRGVAPTIPPLAEPLERMLAGLGPALRAVLSELHQLTDSPHEIEVEFAIKLTADARVVIARAGGEANFRVALRWPGKADSAAQGTDG